MEAQRGDAPSPEVVIDCRKVGKWFGAFEALTEINLQIVRGEVVALIGPSGAGKSTLLRCINGLEPHSAGKLTVLGLELDGKAYTLHTIRTHVGMVFQHFNLFPQMSVLNNVIVAQRLVHRRSPDEARARALDVLDQVDMARHGHKHPGQLSGGEQQRVAIARMLATDPKIVLLDEPTASIDPELTKGIVELMNEIARAGVTVVAVTHEIAFAHEVADRMIYLEGGRIIESGHPDDLIHHAHHERTREFLGAIRRVHLEDDVTESPWAPPVAAKLDN